MAGQGARGVKTKAQGAKRKVFDRYKMVKEMM
jgi:hypothetical protein